MSTIASSHSAIDERVEARVNSATDQLSRYGHELGERNEMYLKEIKAFPSLKKRISTAIKTGPSRFQNQSHLDDLVEQFTRQSLEAFVSTVIGSHLEKIPSTNGFRQDIHLDWGKISHLKPSILDEEDKAQAVAEKIIEGLVNRINDTVLGSTGRQQWSSHIDVLTNERLINALTDVLSDESLSEYRDFKKHWRTWSRQREPAVIEKAVLPNLTGPMSRPTFKPNDQSYSKVRSVECKWSLTPQSLKQIEAQLKTTNEKLREQVNSKTLSDEDEADARRELEWLRNDSNRRKPDWDATLSKELHRTVEDQIGLSDEKWEEQGNLAPALYPMLLKDGTQTHQDSIRKAIEKPDSGLRSSLENPNLPDKPVHIDLQQPFMVQLWKSLDGSNEQSYPNEEDFVNRLKDAGVEDTVGSSYNESKWD
ncbi:uncharacterized protein I206_103833 [Kwoniella pini CBS 10737]|uniref:Uncharacterized protein n=1 Tax=Kwoniella pini CBS 10737 TaxID=1296096 RepID=A0A1B9HSR0_9TREE|nr:uncharacterized protein I206_07786 [Kwoniella pini CBS 10737]OCF46305.1 hypothetical protein I206_07786 [Kwoniella pini CBS 10737]